MATKRRKKTQRVQINVRMREELRARIEKAAKARGVSLNTETLSRLERSFEIEGEDPALHWVMETVTQFAQVIQAQTGKSMWHDPHTFDAVTGVINSLLPYIGPAGESPFSRHGKPDNLVYSKHLLEALVVSEDRETVGEDERREADELMTDILRSRRKEYPK